MHGHMNVKYLSPVIFVAGLLGHLEGNPQLSAVW